MNKSAIEWTETTWNPITGCTKISDGCKNCYAERFAKRLQAMGNRSYRNGFDLTLHPHLLSKPKDIKKPSLIFANSMSDIFHESVPFSYIVSIFDVIHSCPQHIFQILTKRSSRMLNLSSTLDWPDNLIMGVTIESNKYNYRADNLRKTNAIYKFISFEPLLTDVSCTNIDSIDWVIVGGESGHGARPIDPSWVMNLRDKSLRLDIPFFFKQWGGANKKKAGKQLDGKTWLQYPEVMMNQRLQSDSFSV